MPIDPLWNIHWSSGSKSMFMQTNYDGLVWETGILDISSDTTHCDKTAPSSHSRDSVVSLCGVFFWDNHSWHDLWHPRPISVPGDQTGIKSLICSHRKSKKHHAWHKVPDWTMPMALSRLVNRTISFLNTWPIDHGPDMISILKLRRSSRDVVILRTHPTLRFSSESSSNMV